MKETEAIKNAFADIGVPKTRLPLRYFYNIEPISRSQARLLYDHMDSFKEVELDFEAINWMGQGFAHQIFVVYQNEHPDVRLIPINMEKDVEAMYRHVTA